MRLDRVVRHELSGAIKSFAPVLTPGSAALLWRLAAAHRAIERPPAPVPRKHRSMPVVVRAA